MASVALAAWLASAVIAAGARAQTPAPAAAITLDLPAGPLADALAALSRQTRVAIVVDARLVAQRQATAISGSYTAAQALELLLRGSGIEVVPRTEGGFVLRPARGAQDQQLPEIVVTGTKRAQRRQEATQSVAVLSEQDVIGLQSGFDVFNRIPNIAQQSDGFLPTVRGLDGNGVATGGGGAVSGASPRMANYVDGVARTYGATPDGQGSFWDMAQVEVYRGAQSTQLGQNALAGAIVQSTRDPKFQDEYAVQFGLHNRRATYEAAVMANKALGEQVAVRFAAEISDGKNAIDYSGFTGTGLTDDDRDELGRMKYGRYRFKALYLPSDRTSLKLTLEQERRRNPYTADLASNSKRREVNDGSYGWFDSDNRIVALNANHEIDEAWTFDAVLSQQKARTSFGPPVVGNPDPAAFLDFTFESDETAFEPKLLYKAREGRTSAVVGAFVKERDRNDVGQPGSLFALTADDRASSRSLFADATLQLGPDWDLLAAARYVDDHQKRDFSAFGGALAYGFDERNRVFLPKLGATYHHSADAAFSVVAYKGYNASGGGVSFVTFTPYLYAKETAKTIELVSRTLWLDRRLSANANLFFTQLRDAQASGVGPGGPTDGIYVNIAKARTRGLELELDYRPDARASLNFALGLLDTKIVDFGSAANNDNNGHQLGLSPRITAHLGGSMEVMPRLTLGGSVAMMGKRFTDYENLMEDRLGGHAVTNIHAQYRVGRITLTGYVNNLFDKLVQFSRFSALNQAYVNEPRTLGVKARLEF
jgi:iron complex outermembrane recepter protein